MAKLTMAQALNQALHQEMERDSSVLVLGEDVGHEGGVFRVTEGLEQKFGPSRAIDTPLAESGIAGMSIGMAVNGMKPVAEMQFDGFSFYAFHQILSHAARIRNRSRGAFTAPIVVRIPYGGGIKALEHHSESPETFYAHIPGLKVVTPSSPYNAKGLLISAIRDPDPVIFMEPKKLYRAFKEEVPEESYTVPIGKARIAQEGKDITLVAWGATMQIALEAAEGAKAKGIDVEVIDLLTISPCDFASIIGSVKKTGRCVIVQEAVRTLGFASEISARICEEALLSLEAPVRRVTGWDVTVPLAKTEDYYFPNSERILGAIEETMKY